MCVKSRSNLDIIMSSYFQIFKTSNYEFEQEREEKDKTSVKKKKFKKDHVKNADDLLKRELPQVYTLYQISI